jgi:hypothetical protein
VASAKEFAGEVASAWWSACELCAASATEEIHTIGILKATR